MQYSAVQYSAVPCIEVGVQYSAVQCNNVQYSAVQCTEAGVQQPSKKSYYYSCRYSQSLRVMHQENAVKIYLRVLAQPQPLTASVPQHIYVTASSQDCPC